jgi:hypothetical protein
MDARDRLGRISAGGALRGRLDPEPFDLFDDEPEPTVEEMAWEELSFRRRLLGICGFDDEDALALALRPGYGLKEPLELVAQGCSPALAARICL